jgi:hypothetical protein
MRLTSVHLYADGAEAAGIDVITFSLRDAEPSAQYAVRNIVGLDAEEIVPKFYGFGLVNKGRFYNMGMKARDIVLRVVLNPNFVINETYSDVRDELYKAISATRTGQVVLHFNSGATTVARIYGFITKFEVGYFNQLPEVQLTVKCDDPTFRALNPVIYNPTDFGTSTSVIIADSLSTSPHGFNMQITFKATATDFVIQDKTSNPEWKFRVIPSGGFLSGDKLYASSEFTNKYLYMVRASTTTRLMDRVEPQSIWPTIFPGSNTFVFPGRAAFDFNELKFYAAYWGV